MKSVKVLQRVGIKEISINQFCESPVKSFKLKLTSKASLEFQFLYYVDLSKLPLKELDFSLYKRKKAKLSDYISEIQPNIETQQLSEKLLTAKRYLLGKPTDLIAELKSLYSLSKKATKPQTLKIVEYFPDFVIPLFRSLQILKISYGQREILKLDSSWLRISKDQRENYYKLEITTELSRGQSLEVKIQLEKQFKSFENFPNDPQRGHDYLGSLYKLESGTWEQSNALLIFLIEPDFSMPFNVAAVTSATLGFLFLGIFNFTMGIKDEERSD